MIGDLYFKDAGDHRYLVVLSYEPPASDNEAGIVEALIVTPANMVAAAGRRVLMPLAELQDDGWVELDVDDDREEAPS